MLMPLYDFLTLAEARKYPNGQGMSSYVYHPDFKGLYVRTSDVYVKLNGVAQKCTNVVTIANVEANHPGQGAFARLADDLIAHGYAVYVELPHDPRFQRRLEKLGFVRSTHGQGIDFIKGHEGHTHDLHEE